MADRCRRHSTPRRLSGHHPRATQPRPHHLLRQHQHQRHHRRHHHLTRIRRPCRGRMRRRIRLRCQIGSWHRPPPTPPRLRLPPQRPRPPRCPTGCWHRRLARAPHPKLHPSSTARPSTRGGRRHPHRSRLHQSPGPTWPPQPGTRAPRRSICPVNQNLRRRRNLRNLLWHPTPSLRHFPRRQWRSRPLRRTRRLP